MVETYKKWRTETKYFNYYANLILYCIVLVPFLSLAGVKELLGDMNSVVQSAVAVVLGLMVIFKVRKLRQNRFALLYVAFQALIFVRTVMYSEFNMGIFVTICVGVFLVLLMQKDWSVIIRAMTITATLTLIINLWTLLTQDSGELTQYFIGGKNIFSVFLIPAMAFVVVNSLLRKGFITRGTKLFAVLAVLMILLGRSGTGTVAVAAMVVLLIWAWKNKPNVAVWLIVMIVANVMLVFFLEILSGTTLWHRIMELLGKDDTLTSRVAIWERALDILDGHWLLGVGRGIDIEYISRWGYRVVTTESHNFILELILEGGIVGLCLYAVLVWTAVKDLDMDSMLHRLLFVGFITMMINGLAEATNNLLNTNLILALMYTCANKGIYEKKYGH